MFYIGCDYYFYSQYVFNHLESFLSVVRPLTGFTFQFFPFDVYKSLKIFSVVVWKIVWFQSKVSRVVHVGHIAAIPALSPFYFFPPSQPFYVLHGFFFFLKMTANACFICISTLFSRQHIFLLLAVIQQGSNLSSFNFPLFMPCSVFKLHPCQSLQ